MDEAREPRDEDSVSATSALLTRPGVSGRRHDSEMAPDYLRDLLLTHVVPPIIGLMLLGTALGLVVKGLQRAARRAIRASR